MKITAEATGEITQVDGIPCRVWHARTENGVPFLMFVRRVAVPEGADESEFVRDLLAQAEPAEVSLASVYQTFETQRMN